LAGMAILRRDRDVRWLGSPRAPRGPLVHPARKDCPASDQPPISPLVVLGLSQEHGSWPSESDPVWAKDKSTRVAMSTPRSPVTAHRVAYDARPWVAQHGRPRLAQDG
jgi:hypothetical protein